jgi:L,D-peptidoglycan transpeptidase YkuD (ErfK/YbiS/YcfS/YnhG family)
MKRTTLVTLRVFPSPGDRRRGRLVAAGLALPCALGRSGPRRRKREGDGASPVGGFRLRGAYFRADHLPRPRTPLPMRRTRPADGWCDDPRDRRYNRPVPLPCLGVSCERMWRDDGLYDVVVDLDCNRGPIRPGRGSAIFLHVARPGFAPTEGCVALRRADLLRLMPRLGPGTRLVIAG